MTPTIYKPTETDFTHNGLGFLRDCTRCEVLEEANGKFELELDYPLKSRFMDYFENGYQIKAKPNDVDDYHVFVIKQTYKDTISNIITVYAQSRTYKLGNRQVQYVEIDSQNAMSAMKAIENGMDQPSDIKLFSDIQTATSTTFEARNVLNCIAGEQGSLLQYWGGEIKREPFKLSLLRRRGRDDVGVVRYGKDLNGLKIKFNWDMTTRCLPYADLQGSEDGTTHRIYGKAVDSELIGNYPDVYAQYVQFTEEQGVKDLASLDRVAANYFKSINPGCDKPKVSIELEIEKLTDSEEAKEFAKIKNYGLFDTFKVYHKLYDINIDTKITSVTYDALREKTIKIYAGEAQMAFYKQQSNEFQEALKTLTKKNYMSEFVDYVTNLINGVEGGSVLQYPKNKPHTTYYMDTDSRDTAKDVIAINNKGIGFSQTGWLGPFLHAWTIDGKLNADFIRAGTIRAEIFETSFNKIGDQLKLGSGALQALNAGIKIMELTKRGMEFWNSDTKKVGVIGTTNSAGNPFPNANQNPPYEGHTLVIKGENEGHWITLSTKDETGLVIGRDQAIYRGKRFDVNSDVIQLAGDVRIIGSLTLNGQTVIPGQNGGPGTGGGTGTGGYPSEVTSSADKFAWDWWSYALENGYSKAAAAGVLGNIQGEVGPGMNPDTDQAGGPAYGWVQWDGSAYPLVGSATWNGREYVSRLMNAANIKGGISTPLNQARLINWCLYNGQWIGQVNPTSVAGFKNATSPETAAYAFEMNFERPEDAHPERQGWARTWYEKFKDLEAVQEVGQKGLDHLETLVGQRIGNGQCYAASAEYSGYLGGCGLGAGTKYGLTNLTGQGSTAAASDIGIAFNWAAKGWSVVFNPTYEQLMVGAIINFKRGAKWRTWNTDTSYGHTGVIYGLDNGKIQTYEQNHEYGQIISKFSSDYPGTDAIDSICYPAK